MADDIVETARLRRIAALAKLGNAPAPRKSVAPPAKGGRFLFRSQKQSGAQGSR
jgi:hypothetical protein